MIRSFLMLVAYVPFALLFMASMLGNRVCSEIWADMVNFLIH